MAKSRRNRKNRSSRKNSRRNRKMYYGGACALASAAPVGEQYGAAMMAQSLAQGNQFATMTRPYHGGGQSVPLTPSSYKGGRRGSCGMMPQAGGWAEATNPMAAVQEAVKNVAALAGATGSASEAPKPAAPAADSASGSAAMKGGRRRRNSRKNRKGSRKNRRGSRRYRGGMAPLDIFGKEGVDVNRASAMLGGQDTALNEALAYSKANPQMGGRRRRMRGGNEGSGPVPLARTSPHRFIFRLDGTIYSPSLGRNVTQGEYEQIKAENAAKYGQRGGALLEGAPWSQTSSDMLLADSPQASAQAAKMESPAWTGVQNGTFLG